MNMCKGRQLHTCSSLFRQQVGKYKKLKQVNLQNNRHYPNGYTGMRSISVRDDLRSSIPSNRLANTIDLKHPALLYPKARGIKREVHLHIGPTNSGKSYTALQSFKQAKNGIYAGPLRMLAREIKERMDSENIKCNLLTGDDVIRTDGATLYSTTVEMVNLNHEFDVAVIDEIQMLSDPSRGWAWTRAFLGVQSKVIHLCGDACSRSIVEKFCAETGDKLHVHTYSRLSPLTLSKKPIKVVKNNMLLDNNFEFLMPGDCIICFTKREAQRTRDAIVEYFDRKSCCSIVHGSLPPEIRAEQARLFNDPSSDVKYLVATDAIGMGLNLAIKRVIFTKITKFDGIKMRQLETTEIKQIAGRAGRFKTAAGSDGAQGVVACYYGKNIKAVEEALNTATPTITSAYFDPPVDYIRSAYINAKTRRFSSFLKLVSVSTAYSALYKPTFLSMNPTIEVAALFDHVDNLNFEDRLILSFAPVQLKSPQVVHAFQEMCKTVANGESKNVYQLFPSLFNKLNGVPFSEDLEVIHKTVSLFMWLSYRFPCNFIDKKGAQELKELCEQRFSSLLDPENDTEPGIDVEKKVSRQIRHFKKIHHTITG